ncbi:hypothetical protein [Nonomuraea sp. NPDC050310]|uniref:hypothetical protein n=1 Tax=Nonomuraea sp. NPDC050310 TaxID=3154935 RepID=UPI0033E67FA5
MSDKRLAAIWASVGGLESWAEMERAIADLKAGKVSAQSPRAVGAHGDAASAERFRNAKMIGASARIAKEYPSFSEYRTVIQYWKVIKSAAAEHKVDPNALAAVIILEATSREVLIGGFWEANARYAVLGRGAPIGISQLEVYKADKMLQIYYGKSWSSWKISPR